jgi:hypothetical protein
VRCLPAPASALNDHAPAGLFEEWRQRLAKLAYNEEEIAGRQGLTLREYRAWVDT